MRRHILKLARWLKKRNRVLRGIDCLGKSTSVRDVVHLGSEYGGWAVCGVGINADSVIYSCGVGNDTTFDTEIISRFGAIVHAFDPTPSACQDTSAATLDRFIFHNYGIADRDADFVFSPTKASCPDGCYTIIPPDATKDGPASGGKVQMQRLTTTMRTLNHDHIDILKMDIEGAEWSVIEDIVTSKLDIYQILVEFHHLLFRQIGVKATKDAIQLLKDHGYDIFYVSEKGQEYGFIRRDLYASRLAGDPATL